MDEQETTQEKKPETSEAKPDEGGKYETTPIIERAREEREKLEAANKKREELLDREEQIMAKRQLGGFTEAGQPSEKKEETPKEYGERVLRGDLND